jgi:hypothetical protein
MPLSVLYGFNSRKKTALFITAGISSFYLPGETNNYTAVVDGEMKQVIKSYTENKFYFGATADFGIGLTRKFDNGKLLRLLPYVQLPLRKTGFGNLMITSVGLKAVYIFKQ